MTFQPLPTPFQPYAKVGAKVPSNPLPTPVLAHPHTPKGGTHPFEGDAHPDKASNHSKGHIMDNQQKLAIKACDLIVHRSAELMLEQGASVGMVLDRLLTFSAGQACKCDGAFNAAKAFRSIADQIEAGVFAHVEPSENGKGH